MLSQIGHINLMSKHTYYLPTYYLPKLSIYLRTYIYIPTYLPTYLPIIYLHTYLYFI